MRFHSSFYLRDIFLYVFLVTAAVPVELFGAFPLSINDIAVAGLLFLCMVLFTEISLPPHVIFLFFSLFISIFFLCVALVFGNDLVDFRSLLSLVNFYKSGAAYILGYFLISDMKCLKKYSFHTFYILTLVYAVCIISNPDIYGNNGLNLFGITIYGSKGVNASFVYLSSLLMLVLSFNSYKRTQNLIDMFFTIGAVLMIFYSGSRQAILGIALFFLLSLFSDKIRGAVLLFVLILSIYCFKLPDFFWYKMTVKFQALLDYDFNTFSAGRISIYREMITNIIADPIFGRNFSGFSEDVYSQLNLARSSGLSPHNQYIGSIWKMGIVAVIPYFIFLWKILYDFIKIRRLRFMKVSILYFCIISFVVFMNTQDYLLFSLTGNMFMFVGGGLAHILQIKHVNSRKSHEPNVDTDLSGGTEKYAAFNYGENVK